METARIRSRIGSGISNVGKIAVFVPTLAVVGCGSDGADGTDGEKGDNGHPPVINSISSEGSDYVFSVVTDELTDLRFSTDEDCDWANVSTCENGFIIPSVSSKQVRVPLDSPLKADRTWFVRAAHDTERAQQARFSTDVESLLYFGDAGTEGYLIKTELNPVNPEIVSVDQKQTPFGIAADSSMGWVYFSDFDRDANSYLIERTSIHSGEQESVTEVDSRPDYLAIDNENERLFASTNDGLLTIDIGDNSLFGESRNFDDVDRGYAGIAWNPETSELLALSTDDSDECRLRAINVEDGSFRELDRIDSLCSTVPVAIDVENQVAYYDIGSFIDLFKLDLTTGDISDLELESYGGRGMAVDPKGRDLYYRGSLNAVRRQSLDEPSDNEEIIPDGELSFARDAAILMRPAL